MDITTIFAAISALTECIGAMMAVENCVINSMNAIM